MSHRLGGGIALASVLVASGGAVALGDLRAAPFLCAGLLAGAIGGALMCLRHAASMPPWLWLVGALSARAILFAGEPTLSDDEHRYVHEGRAQRHGLATPYRVPPAAFVPAPDDGTSARVNHPDVPAAYPPGAELFLFATVALGDTVGAPRTPLRLALLLADLLVLFALYRRRATLPLGYLAYGFHPLPLLEIALSHHLDALGMALVFFALVLATRPTWAGALVGVAMHIKPIAALALLGIADERTDGAPRRTRAKWRAALSAAAVALLLSMPHLLDRAPLGSGLFEYATRWRASPIVYAVLEAPLIPMFEARAQRGVYAHAHVSLSPPALLIEDAGRQLFALGIPPAHARKVLLDAGFFARLLCGVILGVALVVLARAALSGARRAGAAFAALWLLTPTLHPWYLLWVVPIAALTRSRALWAFAALAPLLYQPAFGALRTGAWNEAWWPRAIILVVTGLAALSDWRDRRV